MMDSYIRRAIRDILKFWRKIKNYLTSWLSYLRADRCLKVIFWISFIVPLLLILLFTVILPVIRFPQSDLFFTNDQPATATSQAEAKKSVASEKHESLRQNWLKLKTQEASLSAAYQLVKMDSIYLVLNLKSNTLNLEIKGVTIRSCPIQRSHLSSGVKYLIRSGLIHQWITAPFNLHHTWASIEKVPIQIREAPRDTIEANEYKEQLIVPKAHDTYITLKFSRSLLLRIDQVQRYSWRDLPLILIYRLHYYISRFFASLADVIHFRISHPDLRIQIAIARNDATAIYRALPRQAQLILYIDE